MVEPTESWSLLILFILISFLQVISTNGSTYFYHSCDNNTIVAPNSKYQSNVNTVLRSLSSHAAASNSSSGFFATTPGNVTADAIYGLYLCRGDQNITGCSDCVATATATDLPKTYCPNRKVAIIWYDECIVRYSDKSLLGNMEANPAIIGTNTRNITGNQTQFSELTSQIMNNVTNQAASSLDKLGRRYGTERAYYTNFQNLYSLAQCTPDLTDSDCNQCLVTALGYISNSYVQGARILQPSCNIRYEIYPFFDEANDLPLVHSPSSTTTSSTDSPPISTNFYHVCDDNTIVEPNSTYQTNINVVLGLFSSSVEASNSLHGFYNTTAGIGTGYAIYGLYLCRGDLFKTGNLESMECRNCVITATNTDLPKTCPNRKVAIIWYDECMVRYSDQPLIGMLVTDPEIIHTSMVDKDQPGLTENIIGPIMNRVIEHAANGNKLSQKFRTETVYNTTFQQLYTLAQCTPDLSEIQCSACLWDAVEKITYVRLLGGWVLQPSCSIRFEIYSFFYQVDDSPQSESQSPPSPFTVNSTENSSSTGKSTNHSTKLIVIIISVIVVSTTFLAICIYLTQKKANYRDAMFVENGCESEDFTTIEFLRYELSTLQYATNNFSEENKVGEGGFGGVFKGTLPDGQEIAVKRLSRSSDQGIQEFKNEVVLVAKLQHKNLVRLLGFCLARNEMLLVYEYVANKSLDYFLFGREKQEKLDWERRYTIIREIARGMLYLHQDSRLRIIHRDLKASNVLLDADMNPKISDFGMARIFGKEQMQGNTNRVVGTFGYMSPEYAMHGQFSVKSDVYSFGVLVLEIVSSKRNNTFYESGYADDLISYAWKQWKKDIPLEFVDPTIRDLCSSDEVMRCIHLGLLCIQDNIDNRPTMEKVVLALDSHSVFLPLPEKPVFFINNKAKLNFTNEVGSSNLMRNSNPSSMNDLSITEFEPR